MPSSPPPDPSHRSRKRSPLGNRLAILSPGDVFKEKDYIFPLNFNSDYDHDHDDIRAHLMEQRDANIWYFVGVYINEADVDSDCNREIFNREGLSEFTKKWQICEHRYLKLLEDGQVRYLDTLGGAAVWHQILVPYPVEFTREINCEITTDSRKFRVEDGRDVTCDKTRRVLEVCFPMKKKMRDNDMNSVGHGLRD
jgi:hypothetical protein